MLSEKGGDYANTGIHTFPNVEGIEKKIGNNVKLNQAFIGLLGGFSSTSIRKRKPIYAAIMAGSKIEASNDKEALGLAREGLGLFSNIGFGSVIPLI